MPMKLSMGDLLEKPKQSCLPTSLQPKNIIITNNDKELMLQKQRDWGGLQGLLLLCSCGKLRPNEIGRKHDDDIRVLAHTKDTDQVGMSSQANLKIAQRTAIRCSYRPSFSSCAVAVSDANTDWVAMDTTKQHKHSRELIKER
ncbi:hypothetical protein MLD38_029325 [Melastoma candidum]|uniref:Uncharacterized protein n=1 Tax=Melastoma candidum TaxID=119954 RepID=A0ACB9N3S5_9MYRT|nr:hypothetical protein MLD38_029325 [Melastoma candidum]